MAYEFLAGKSILVTGGTGSFGQFFVQYLLERTEAKKIIIFSRDELKQSQMQSIIPDPDNRLRFFLGDIRDQARLQRAFYNVDIVVHAAALKQVPTLEYNPFEAVKTNILGTQHVINAAIDANVKKVLLVSTDKAANPANLYGATKLCAEKLVVSGNAYSDKDRTALSVVRYGNVLGSRGSLLKIVEQKRASGEIGLTHEDMTRFWLTLEQGIEMVLLSLEKMMGGEIFIPKIPTMDVRSFLETVAPECTITPIGIRPGEKIHEMLITPEEARNAREYDTHYVILPEHTWWEDRGHHEATAVPEGFSLVSDNTDIGLDRDGLLALLKNVL